MREVVDRILEGNFNNDVHSLSFSSPLIELKLEPGEKYEGSFTIFGKPNVMTEGTVSTTELRMKCLVESFTGTEEEIPYVFDAAGMIKGDSLKGEFRVISNQGEYLIPYHVEIVQCIYRKYKGYVSFCKSCENKLGGGCKPVFLKGFRTGFTGVG